MTDPTDGAGPQTLSELYDQVVYLRDHLQERPEMTPRERGQLTGARDMAAVIASMIEQLMHAPPPGTDPSDVTTTLRLLKPPDQ